MLENQTQLTSAQQVLVETFSIDKTLEERGSQYGPFKGHAEITQRLKGVIHDTHNWHNKLTDSQCEALDMIVHKIGRILNGNPNFVDSWHDIIGYAKLVEDELRDE